MLGRRIAARCAHPMLFALPMHLHRRSIGKRGEVDGSMLKLGAVEVNRHYCHLRLAGARHVEAVTVLRPHLTRLRAGGSVPTSTPLPVARQCQDSARKRQPRPIPDSCSCLLCWCPPRTRACRIRARLVPGIHSSCRQQVWRPKLRTVFETSVLTVSHKSNIQACSIVRS